MKIVLPICLTVLIAAASVIGYMEVQRQRGIHATELQEQAQRIEEQQKELASDANRIADNKEGRAKATQSIPKIASEYARLEQDRATAIWESRNLQGFNDAKPQVDQQAIASRFVEDYNLRAKLMASADSALEETNAPSRPQLKIISPSNSLREDGR